MQIGGAHVTDEGPVSQGVVWKILDVLFAKGGRRDYDKRRVGLLLAMLAILEICVRLGYRVIDRQFDAYSQAMTRVQTTEVEERRISTDRMVKGLDQVGEKIDTQTTAVQDLTMTIREAWLMRGGTPSKKRTP
jgi:hypothetical protein